MQGRDGSLGDSFGLFTAALRDLWAARRMHAALSVIVTLPLTVIGLLGLLDPLYAAMAGERQTQGLGLAIILFFLWGVTWNAPAVVLWYRRFLLGPEQLLRIAVPDLIQRSLWFALYYVAMVIVGMGASLLLLTLLGAVLAMLGGGDFSALPLVVVMFSVLCYLASRLSLVFAGITLGRRVSFQDSWQRTKGRGMTIFGAFTLAVLLAMIASGTVSSILAMLTGANTEGAATPPAIYFFIDLVASPFAYASAALPAAIAAEVYRRLMGEPVDVSGIRV